MLASEGGGASDDADFVFLSAGVVGLNPVRGLAAKPPSYRIQVVNLLSTQRQRLAES